jgi:hypothetical protein
VSALLQRRHADIAPVTRPSAFIASVILFAVAVRSAIVFCLFWTTSVSKKCVTPFGRFVGTPIVKPIFNGGQERAIHGKPAASAVITALCVFFAAPWHCPDDPADPVSTIIGKILSNSDTRDYAHCEIVPVRAESFRLLWHDAPQRLGPLKNFAALDTNKLSEPNLCI